VAGRVLRRGGEGEEAQAQVYPEKKAARGCSGLRSPWRGSRRRRRLDNGGGALGQRHSTRTAMWSASDPRDGTVETGMREVRRGQRRQRVIVFRHWPVGNGRSERLLTRTHASGHHRPRKPTRARCGVTLPLTAGLHTSVFFCIKNTPERK
jgi:hypothetical protein